MMLKNFVVVGWLEGISYLVLFFNMLVIKNINPDLYQTLLYPIGMAHGLLFIGYTVLAIILKIDLNWSFKKRSEEHTSELQSRGHVVCRLRLEKKKSS